MVQPDLLCVLRERLGIIHKANIEGAPDLVVEILSPSTNEGDRVRKRKVYAQYGVRELWLVDPETRSIELATRNGSELATTNVFSEGTTPTSPALGGFALSISEFFREKAFEEALPE